MKTLILIVTSFLTICTQLTAQSVELQNGGLTPSPLLSIEASGSGIITFQLIESSGLSVDPDVFGMPTTTITITLSRLELQGSNISAISVSFSF